MKLYVFLFRQNTYLYVRIKDFNESFTQAIVNEWLFFIVKLSGLHVKDGIFSCASKYPNFKKIVSILGALLCPYYANQTRGRFAY